MFSRRVATTSVCGAARFNAVAAESRSKMQTLHKILLGEVTFKNKALVKESNVESVFGAEWKKELEAYGSKLPAEEKKILDRQVARLSLTRYTTRELAQFAAKGPENVDAAANAFMVAEARKMIASKGETAFIEHVNAEAKLANWTDAAVKKFIAEVKTAKK